MPLTPAEKQAAYRARKLEAQEDFAGPVFPEVVQPTAHDSLERVDLEAYVARELAITKTQSNDPDKLKRSEAYARWRWREFYAGTVSSL